MEKKGNQPIDGLRAAVRPALLWMLGFGSFIFIMEGIEGTFVTGWITMFFATAGEWVVERPILKIAGRIKGSGERT